MVVALGMGRDDHVPALVFIDFACFRVYFDGDRRGVKQIVASTRHLRRNPFRARPAAPPGRRWISLERFGKRKAFGPPAMEVDRGVEPSRSKREKMQEGRCIDAHRQRLRPKSFGIFLSRLWPEDSRTGVDGFGCPARFGAFGMARSCRFHRPWLWTVGNHDTLHKEDSNASCRVTARQRCFERLVFGCRPEHGNGEKN